MGRLRIGLALLVIVGMAAGVVFFKSETDEEQVRGLVNRYLAALSARDWQAIYGMLPPDLREPTFEEAEPGIIELYNDMVEKCCGVVGPSSPVTIGGTDVDVLVTGDKAGASWKATCNGEPVNCRISQPFDKVDGKWYLRRREP